MPVTINNLALKTSLAGTEDLEIQEASNGDSKKTTVDDVSDEYYSYNND